MQEKHARSADRKHASREQLLVSGARQSRNRNMKRGAQPRQARPGLAAWVPRWGAAPGGRDRANDLPEPARPGPAVRRSTAAPAKDQVQELRARAVAVLPFPPDPRAPPRKSEASHHVPYEDPCMDAPRSLPRGPFPSPSRTLPHTHTHTVPASASRPRLVLVVALAQQTGLRPIPFPSSPPRPVLTDTDTWGESTWRTHESVGKRRRRHCPRQLLVLFL